MSLTAAFALVLTLQGDAGVLPANPVSPLLVASGGTAVATVHLGSLLLNPANATGVKGIELAVVSYPRTNLEGFSVTAAGGRRLRVITGLWSYSLKDIFDPELVAQDPSLNELGLSMAAGSLGTAFRVGHLSAGAQFVARTQNIVGTHTAASSVSAGGRLDLKALELAASVFDAPITNSGSAAAPQAGSAVGVAATTHVAAFDARVEVNARHLHATGWDFGVSPHIKWGPIEVRCGYDAHGWSGGASLRHGRILIQAATNIVRRDRLDQRVALSVTIQ